MNRFQTETIYLIMNQYLILLVAFVRQTQIPELDETYPKMTPLGNAFFSYSEVRLVILEFRSGIVVVYCGFLKFLPANLTPWPISSSMRRIWLYLAKRSDRQGAPVLI